MTRLFNSPINDSLDSVQIKAQLQALNFTHPYELYTLSTTASTNQFLMDLPSSPNLILCCAEEQTAGRGRFGRQWRSPFGENIYYSLRWSNIPNPNQLAGLSLVVGLAILKTIKAHLLPSDDTLRIKWPNDLIWQNKKLCGILIELSQQDTKTHALIIGIGLNVHSTAAELQLSEKPWCSLFDIKPQVFNRNDLIAELTSHLSDYLERFFEQGFPTFLAEWAQYDGLCDQWITVTQVNRTFSGYARGVNSEGNLCLEDSQGMIHQISAGEASIAR